MPERYIEIEGQIFSVDGRVKGKSSFSIVAAELATAVTLALTGCKGSVSPVPTESVGPMVTPTSRDVEPTPSSSPTIVPEVEVTDRPTETTEPTVTPEATATLVPISPEYHLDGPEGFGGVDTNGEFLSEEQRVEANKQWGFYKPYIEKMIEVEQYSGFVGVDNPTGIVAAVRVLDDGRVVVYPKVVGGEKDGIIILPMGTYFDMEGIRVPEMPQDWDPSQVTELSKGNGERAYYDDKYLTIVRADSDGNVFEAWNHSEGRWEMVEKEWTGIPEFKVIDQYEVGLRVNESKVRTIWDGFLTSIAARDLIDVIRLKKELKWIPSSGINDIDWSVVSSEELICDGRAWEPSDAFRKQVELYTEGIERYLQENGGVLRGLSVPVMVDTGNGIYKYGQTTEDVNLLKIDIHLVNKEYIDPDDSGRILDKNYIFGPVTSTDPDGKPDSGCAFDFNNNPDGTKRLAIILYSKMKVGIGMGYTPWSYSLATSFETLFAGDSDTTTQLRMLDARRNIIEGNKPDAGLIEFEKFFSLIPELCALIE